MMFLMLACHNFGYAVIVQRRIQRNIESISPRKHYFPPHALYRPIYGSTILCWSLAAFFIFLFYTQSVGRRISPTQGRHLLTEQH
jgi:hypothetical protein